MCTRVSMHMCESLTIAEKQHRAGGKNIKMPAEG